jgi:hypothetical protein
MLLNSASSEIVNVSHINNHPPNTELEHNHAKPEPSLYAVLRCRARERNSSRTRKRSIRRSCITTPRESQAVRDVEEDIDIPINTSEQLLAGTHGEDRDVGEGVDSLVLVSVRG